MVGTTSISQEDSMLQRMHMTKEQKVMIKETL